MKLHCDVISSQITKKEGNNLWKYVPQLSRPNFKICLTCFFNLNTLNLSKSVSARLFSRRSRRFAQALSSHLSSTFCSFQALATGARPAARGNFAMTMGVTMRFARLLEWRGTPAFSFVEGPSTSTCRYVFQPQDPPCKKTSHTKYIRACDQLFRRLLLDVRCMVHG